MSLSIGIVGLPNVGKSTLFNALLKRTVALAANYPFATIEPNVGIVEVPDPRLTTLAQIVNKEFGAKYPHKETPEKIIYSTIKFVDIAGLVAGAHKGEGLGNQFLSHIREVDAIAQVVRCFTDENVLRAGSSNPKDDADLINTELILADLQTIEKQRLEVKGVVPKEELLRIESVKKVKEVLENGALAQTADLTPEEKHSLKSLNLLTLKPIIYILNTDENIKEVDINLGRQLVISARIESEIAVLSEEDQKLYMDELGMDSSGLDKLIKESFDLLGLQTFLTAGPKEVRSWTIKQGSLAPQAAGVIHSDFEKGMISAEVISFDNLVSAGSWKDAKDKGLIRIEGKSYVMKEGDIVEFRINL